MDLSGRGKRLGLEQGEGLPGGRAAYCWPGRQGTAGARVTCCWCGGAIAQGAALAGEPVPRRVAGGRGWKGAVSGRREGECRRRLRGRGVAGPAGGPLLFPPGGRAVRSSRGRAGRGSRCRGERCGGGRAGQAGLGVDDALAQADADVVGAQVDGVVPDLGDPSPDLDVDPVGEGLGGVAGQGAPGGADVADRSAVTPLLCGGVPLGGCVGEAEAADGDAGFGEADFYVTGDGAADVGDGRGHAEHLLYLIIVSMTVGQPPADACRRWARWRGGRAARGGLSTRSPSTALVGG
ncbi:hypothetical protein RKD42_000477 [Streptomyces ambofaciens]